MRLIGARALVASIAALSASPLTASNPTPLLVRFGLDPARVLSGAGVEVCALPSAAPDGIAVVGAIRILMPPQLYLEWSEDLIDFDSGAKVQASGRLSQPPAAADFRALSLSEKDLTALASCRIGSCELQLDNATIERMRALDWRSRTAATSAKAIFREMMIERARRYEESGNSALVHYHDSRRPTDISDHLADLIAEETAAGIAPSAMIAALQSPPSRITSADASYLYWATNAFGLKPTTRLNHTIVMRNVAPDLAGVVATKMLYASHYFHGALDLRYVVADPGDANSFVLIAVTRTRSDGLTGFTGALIGGTVRARALEAMRDYLRFTKQSAERRYRAAK